MSKPSEWLRIQPRGESYKQGRAEGNGLRVGHKRCRRVAGLFEPCMNYDAEIVVEGRNDVEGRENRQHGMMRFDEREEDEVLAHEAGRGRNAREREHEDKEQNGGGGVALVEAVEIVELVADDALLAENDDEDNVVLAEVDDASNSGDAMAAKASASAGSPASSKAARPTAPRWP